MFGKKTITVFLLFGVLSLFILVAYIFLSFKYGLDTELFERPTISKEKAVTLARGFLESLGLKTKHYPTQKIEYACRNKEVLYLLKNFGAKEVRKLVKKEKIPYAYWSIVWSGLGTDSLHVQIDSQDGRIVGYDFSHTPSSKEKIINSKDRQAKDLAERFLISQGFDLKSLELTNISKNTRNIQEEYFYKWISPDIKLAEGRYIINVSVEADKISSYSSDLELPQDFIYEYNNSQFINNFWMGLSVGFSFLLGIILIVFAIIKRKTLDWKLGKLWAKILGLVFLAYFLNEQSSNYLFIDITYKLIGAVLLALVIFILIPVASSSFKEGFGREMFLTRNRHEILASIIICYSITFITLLVVSATYQILNHFKITWDTSVGNITSEIFTAKLTFLSPFLIGIIPAFTEEFFRGFTIAFVKKISRSSLLSILVAAFLWGFGHTVTDGSFYPGYIVGMEKFVNGILVGYILLYFGIEIAILWHFLNNFFATNIFLFYLGPNLAVYAGLSCLLMLSPFFVAVYHYFKKPNTLVTQP